MTTCSKDLLSDSETSLTDAWLSVSSVTEDLSVCEIGTIKIKEKSIDTGKSAIHIF